MFNIKEVIAQYEDVFNKLNEKYFDNELPMPVISIQKGKGDAYGWCTTYQAWKKDDVGYYEINLCAEYLDRTPEQLSTTIFHEMIHLRNAIDKVIDCSGKYHNAKFKKTAEKFGLIVEKTSYGYSTTTLNDDQLEFIRSLELKDFGFKRLASVKKVSTNKGNKYQCPSCGVSFWSSKILNVHCEDCDEDFEIVN